MKTANKRFLMVLAIIGGGALILAVAIALTKPDEKAEAWNAEAEGFLAVATATSPRLMSTDLFWRESEAGVRLAPSPAVVQ